MKRDLGLPSDLFPMPVLMITTYNDDDSVDVMNMAWGGICGNRLVALNISEGHRTAANIRKRGAFTISVADIPICRSPITSEWPAATKWRANSRGRGCTR